MTSPAEVLSLARSLLHRPEAYTAGMWPRASALLARQALEMTLDDFWRQRRPGVEECSAHAQLLCLSEFWRDREEAGRINLAWVALSRACHHHPYELAPTAGELEGWFGVVEEALDADPVDEVRKHTRNDKAIQIVRLLLERIQVSDAAPLTLRDAITFARHIGADQGDALLAIERLAQTGAIRRVFVDVTQDPPKLMSWDEVLVRLGGRDGLCSDAWREGARTIAVQWFPAGETGP